MNREKETTTENIRKLLEKNYIARNSTLSIFIRLLNSIDKNMYLSVDGKWGSGKTIFVKQLELLNYLDLSDTSSPNYTFLAKAGIDDDAVLEFQSKYIAYYYNAWHNDNHGDPIQSLILNLVNDYKIKDGLGEKTQKITEQILKNIVIEGIKTLSKGVLNLEDIDNEDTFAKLTKHITTINERKDAVSKIIKTLLPEGKKFLFIIDEIDRCMPSYAIKTLEAIKHYCDDDNIVFIVSTNNTQLSHTIKKFYGNDFDGAGYLNKFYDTIFQLPNISRERYISDCIGLPVAGHIDSGYAKQTADYLEMSMREMDRYYSSLNMVMKYIRGEITPFGRRGVYLITKMLFVPLALGLKIMDFDKYSRFVSGSGEEILDEFCNMPEFNTGIIGSDSVKPSNDRKITKKQQVEFVVETYKKLFITRSEDYDDNYDYHVDQERYDFQNAVSLMSHFSQIGDKIDGN